jgi:hypothetical protein
VTWDDRHDHDHGDRHDRGDYNLRTRDDRGLAISLFPVLLIAFGAAALLHGVAGHGVSVFPLAIGIFLIARSRNNGSYPFLVAGAVLAGSGLGNLVGDLIHSGASDAVGTLGTAGGFLWLANADRGRSSWALVPAAIVGLIGLGELGFHATDLVNGGAGGWLLPAGVVVAGILLLGAHRMPGPLRLAGLVFVGAAALSLLTNAGDNRGNRNDRRLPIIPTLPSSQSGTRPLNIGERAVWVDTSSGQITVTESAAATVQGSVSVEDTGNILTIKPAKPSTDVRLAVPAGTKLHLVTTSGDIKVDVPVQLDATTNSGKVTADVSQVSESKPLSISTTSGDVTLSLAGDPKLNATTVSGDLNVEGFNADVKKDKVFFHLGVDGLITLNTTSGDIEVHQLEGSSAGAGAR